MAEINNTMNNIKLEVNVLTNLVKNSFEKEMPASMKEFNKQLKDVQSSVGTMAEAHQKAFENIIKKNFGAEASLEQFSSGIEIVSGAMKTFSAASDMVGLASEAVSTVSSVLSGAMNPLTLLIPLIAAVVSGIILWNDSANKLSEEQQRLIDSTKAENEAITEQLQAYQELQKTQSEKANADLTLIDHTNKLWKEMQTLADESGKVQEKDQSRAQFILGELNRAYGTEYEMIGGVIQSYQDMQLEIDKVIEKKKWEAVEMAAFEVYQQAILEEKKALNDMTRIENELADERIKLLALEEEKEIARSEVMGRRGKEEVARIQREIDLQNEIIASKEDSYNKAALINAQSLADQEAYESASQLALEGHVDAAVSLWTDHNSGLRERVAEANGDMTQIRKIYEEEYASSKGELEKYLEEVKNGTSEYDEERLAALTRHASSIYKQGESIGANLGDGMIVSMNNKKMDLGRTTDSVIGSMVNNVKKFLGIKSPSKVFEEIGKFTGEGLEIGIRKESDGVVEAAKDQVSELIDTMSGNKLKNAFNMAAGTISAALVLPQAQLAMASIPGSAYYNNYNTYNEQAPVVIQNRTELDGEVIYENQQKVVRNHGEKMSTGGW